METTLVETAAARLQTLAGQNPRMAEAVEYYRCLIPALIAAGDQIPPISLPADHIEKKLELGIALLVDEEYSIEPHDCREVFLSLCQAIRQGFENSAENQPGCPTIQEILLDPIIRNAENGILDPLALLSAVSLGQNGFINETAALLNLDARLLDLVTKNTLKAFLHAWRKGLQPFATLEHWQRGICPFCGNPPALAEAQGVERARYLRCIQCGARWPYPNLKCAFCGNSDHRALGILQLDDDTGKYYAHTCEQCQRYIKTIATFDPIPAVMLLVEDLATLHLDTLAIEKGYQ